MFTILSVLLVLKKDWTLIKVSKEMYLIFSGGRDAQFRY